MGGGRKAAAGAAGALEAAGADVEQEAGGAAVGDRGKAVGRQEEAGGPRAGGYSFRVILMLVGLKPMESYKARAVVLGPKTCRPIDSAPSSRALSRQACIVALP